MIMIAEDQADSREYLVRLLRRKGYRVIGVEDGQAALEAARMNPPQLFILDENMPGLTGMELFERILTEPALKAAKVIFFSATFEHDLAKRALEMGAMEWLVKGVHGPQHLLTAVARGMMPPC